jgi:peptidoglycan hydrolase-like protein with peptidoglycan-binding domain
MYELGMKGLGWSEISGYPTCESVTGGGIKRCFTSAASDQNCARSCGCIQTSENCTTSSGNGGTQWCCPRDCPSTTNGCTPRTQNLICDLSRVDIGSLTDTRSRAIWVLKNRLCSQRIDPGAVNGTQDQRLVEALRTFQTRQGLPVTGQADAATLYQLGFTAAEAQQYSTAIAQPLANIQPMQLPWLLIGATSVASLFMMYAVWRFRKKS